MECEAGVSVSLEEVGGRKERRLKREGGRTGQGNLLCERYVVFNDTRGKLGRQASIRVPRE